jgi:polysaccharide biosynthesis protein PslJ
VFVALATLVEWKNGYNFFNHLERLCPLLDLNQSMIPQVPERAGRPRAYASSQHAIALGAAFVMLLPLALYLFKRTNYKPWMVAALLLVMGALATTSRTAVTMLVALLFVFLWIKRKETVRMLPMLLPLILVLQVAMPGTLGTFKAILFPKEGLISEEQQGEGVGTGRVQDLGPSLQEWGRKPLFGEGFGTRLTSLFDKKQNARIVDDQWLSSLLETGAIGVAALLWLIVRAVRRLKLLAKRDDSSFGWLLTGLAAAITAYGIGMVTYDAFSFIQVTFLFFLLLGISGAALALPEANGMPELGVWPQPLPSLSLRRANEALARVTSPPDWDLEPDWEDTSSWDEPQRWDAVPPDLSPRGRN